MSGEIILKIQYSCLTNIVSSLEYNADEWLNLDVYTKYKQIENLTEFNLYESGQMISVAPHHNIENSYWIPNVRWHSKHTAKWLHLNLKRCVNSREQQRSTYNNKYAKQTLAWLSNFLCMCMCLKLRKMYARIKRNMP